MRAAIAVEWLKLRHSRVVHVTTLALLTLPCALAAGFLAAAGQGGADAMSLKASAMVTGEGWDGYLNGAIQIFATAGLLGMGVVVAWCFGREFADRTVVSLYGSATPREIVAAAKYVVVSCWALLIAVLVGPAALLVGLAAGLGTPDRGTIGELGRLSLLAVLTGLLALGVAIFASAGRGYLPGFGGLIALIVVAQVGVVAGLGGWLPWSVPGLWAVATPGSGLDPVPTAQLAVVPLSTLVLVGVTVGWWRRAELR
jgi:ABC-2 type transport system permease protein